MQNPFEQIKAVRHKLTRFMMLYQFALEEIETKLRILTEEFRSLHEYNPIEHTKSRLKSPESIMKKLQRKGAVTSLAQVKENVRDIAGLRIVCSFTEDIYWISNMLQNQSDLKVIERKDYIQNPKPNGYRSLHLIVQVPVFLSDRVEHVYVEVQIRTIAMDFWASLEHKIFYKYQGTVPQPLLDDIIEAAETANTLDRKMEHLHHQIASIKMADASREEQELLEQFASKDGFRIPEALMKMMADVKL